MKDPVLDNFKKEYIAIITLSPRYMKTLEKSWRTIKGLQKVHYIEEEELRKKDFISNQNALKVGFYLKQTISRYLNNHCKSVYKGDYKDGVKNESRVPPGFVEKNKYGTQGGVCS